MRHRIQPAINLDVDPAHEERRHALQSFQGPAAGQPLLQPAEEGIEHGAVTLDREDQGHVDGDAGGQRFRDGGKPRQRRRDLDEQVGSVHQPPQPSCLGRRARGILGDAWIDLDGHPAIPPARAGRGGMQHVAGGADIPGGEQPHGLADRGAPQRQVVHLLLVAGARADRLGKDRRVGGDPDDPPCSTILASSPDWIRARLRSSSHTATPVSASCCKALAMTAPVMLVAGCDGRIPTRRLTRRRRTSDCPGRRARPPRW